MNVRNKIPDTWNTNLIQLLNGKQIDQREYPYLMRMIEDAKSVMKDVLKNCKKVEDDCEIYL